jgi:hypothetical protein
MTDEMYDGGDAPMIRAKESWYKMYPIVPRKVKGEWYWLKPIYYRVAWRADNGFSFDNEYEYGTILDVLKDEY